jgi:predicted small lipoprotein YifL
MAMIRALATLLFAALALAACGQKGDLKLPGAKAQPGMAGAQAAPPQPPASTPAPASHK